MKANRLKWFFGLPLIALIVLVLVTQPNQRPISKAKLGFKVLESDALFFKNLRQFYYEREVRKDADFELFRHPDQIQFEPNAPRLIIVNNWKHDEAYLFFETKAGTPFEQVIRFDSNKDSFEYDLSGLNAAEQQQIAVNLYDVLKSKDLRCSVLSKNEWYPIWDNEAERGVVRMILKDYFKLTGSL